MKRILERCSPIVFSTSRSISQPPKASQNEEMSIKILGNKVKDRNYFILITIPNEE